MKKSRFTEEKNISILREADAGVRTDPNAPQHSILSACEYKIVQSLARGESVTAIANDLALSITTVSTYRSRILEKMHMKGNADLTSYALRNDLFL